MSRRRTHKATPTPTTDLGTALATVRNLAPTLYQQPEVLKELAALLIRAESIGEGHGLTPPSGRSYMVRSSPTVGQPVAAGFTGWGGRDTPQGVANANTLRSFADRNPWVASAITLRTQQIGRSAIACLPADERKPFNKKVQQAVTHMLDLPNEYRESYRTIIERVLRDILTIDRGCISKSIDLGGTPHAIYAEDGATIRIYPNWDGDPNKPRYAYVPPTAPQNIIPLRNDQLICIMANDASYRYGLAPVQILYDTIEADLTATKSAKNLVANKPPPHLINIPGASQGSIDALVNRFEAEIAGNKNIFFTGSDQNPQVSSLVFSLKDNQWLEWQTYLARKICAVFQISPQQIGITFDVNRSTSETQDEEFKDNGLIPLLLLLEEYMNREFLYDFAPKDRDGMPNITALNLRIIYPEVSEMQRMLHAERTIIALSKAMPGTPLLTQNMALRMLGEEPVDGGNTFYLATKTGMVPWLSYDGGTGDFVNATATTGELGAQDAAAGPTDPPDTSDDTTTDDAPVAPAADAQDAPATQQSHLRDVRQYDMRSPGMAWQPTQRSITKSAKSTGRPNVTQAARDTLQARAHAIFAEVWKE